MYDDFLYKAVRAAYFYLVEFKLSEVKFLKKVNLIICFK